ncbi:MAG: hypothetical protein BWY71_00913 [Planctomycetes bacterium ADurb.Bin412]|nr:MAG: hypothetical protein BWY71_00913 [Planctomycetes bacterium ADurb.Bin412]
MKKHVIWAGLVLAIYLNCPAWVSAEPQWLQYRTARETREILGDIGYQNLNFTTNRIRQDDPNRVHLTALSFFKANPDGSVVELERWTTLFPSTAWGIGVREGEIDSAAKWLNHPENFQIDIPLEVGREQTFTFQMAHTGDIQDYYGLNFFFDGREAGLEGPKPGISVYSLVDSTGLQDGNPEFLVNRAGQTQGWPFDPSVPGAGTLVYDDPIKGIRVTLTRYAMYPKSVFKLDYIQPSPNGYPIAPDGSPDPVGQFTLRAERYEAVAPAETEKPAPLILPKAAGSDLLLAKWNAPLAKGGFLWVILDVTQNTSGTVCLYIDSDGDGNLENENPIRPSFTDNYRLTFGPVQVPFEVDGEPVSYHVNFMFYNRSDYTRLYAYAGGWYEGPVRVGDTEQFCMLMDQNANGTFDDKSVNFGDSDRIRIGPKDQGDSHYVGNYIQLAGQFYELHVARDGAYIELAAAQDLKYGSVQVPETITEFSAGGENGLFTVPLEKGKGSLPAGTYRIEHWGVERKDDQGANWKLAGRWFDDKGIFSITPDQQTDLKIGEPIVSTLEDRTQGKEHYFNQRTAGSLGEYIELTCNGSRPSAPSVRIKNQNGSYDRKFTLEYG